MRYENEMLDGGRGRAGSQEQRLHSSCAPHTSCRSSKSLKYTDPVSAHSSRLPSLLQRRVCVPTFSYIHRCSSTLRCPPHIRVSLYQSFVRYAYRRLRHMSADFLFKSYICIVMACVGEPHSVYCAPASMDEQSCWQPLWTTSQSALS